MIRSLVAGLILAVILAGCGGGSAGTSAGPPGGGQSDGIVGVDVHNDNVPHVTESIYDIYCRDYGLFCEYVSPSYYQTVLLLCEEQGRYCDVACRDFGEHCDVAVASARY